MEGPGPGSDPGPASAHAQRPPARRCGVHREGAALPAPAPSPRSPCAHLGPRSGAGPPRTDRDEGGGGAEVLRRGAAAEGRPGAWAARGVPGARPPHPRRRPAGSPQRRAGRARERLNPAPAPQPSSESGSACPERAERAGGTRGTRRPGVGTGANPNPLRARGAGARGGGGRGGGGPGRLRTRDARDPRRLESGEAGAQGGWGSG